MQLAKKIDVLIVKFQCRNKRILPVGNHELILEFLVVNFLECGFSRFNYRFVILVVGLGGAFCCCVAATVPAKLWGESVFGRRLLFQAF